MHLLANLINALDLNATDLTETVEKWLGIVFLKILFNYERTEGPPHARNNCSPGLGELSRMCGAEGLSSTDLSSKVFA